MSIFKCKICGGDMEIAQGQTVCECEHCGSTQTLPQIDDEAADVHERLLSEADAMFADIARALGIALDAACGAEANAAAVQRELQNRVDQQGADDATEDAYRQAAAGLKKLGDRPHAAVCAALCEKLAEIDAAQKAEKERIQTEAAGKAADKRKMHMAAIAAAVVAALAAVCLFVLIPLMKYNAAKELLASGKYNEAYTAFLAVRGYADVNTLLETDSNLKAAACEAAAAPFKKVGRYVTYGHYEQDNNINNGKEAVEWLVLDYNATTNQALLISRYGLDASEYGVYPTWEKTDIRAWLNDTFINDAFTADEQKTIATASITTPAYGHNSGGNDTKDKIWLLSKEEVTKYFKDDDARKTVPTKYAAARRAYQYSGTTSSYKLDGAGCCWWWLRSPGYYTFQVFRVDLDGSFSHCAVGTAYGAVRPALWLDLAALIP